jgi:cell division inhibitor SepF
MGTMQKLKAYFGMIPADELDGYGDPEDYDDYGPYGAYEDYASRSRDGYERHTGADERVAGWRGSAAGRSEHDREFGAEPARPARGAGSRRTWAAEAPTRGALAVEPTTGPALRSVNQSSAARPDGVTEAGLSRITTLCLRSYNEARSIGEPYRDGIPVIMNVTEMADADAKRLVDFAAGLAFALRGSIEKVTSKVFLLSPPNVEVTAEDKRKIAEDGFFSREFSRA